MGFARDVLYFDNSGSPTAGGNVGPLVVSGITKLLGVRVRGDIMGGYVSVAAGSATDNEVFMGVQWVPHGSPPLSLVIDSTLANFVAVGQCIFGTSIVAWAPTSGPGEVGYWRPIDLSWRGQLPISTTLDVYFSTAQTVGSGGTWAASGSLEVDFA